MRAIRPYLRHALVALLAIAVNLPTLGAAAICSSSHAKSQSRTQTATSCCAPKVATAPAACCCSRVETRDRSDSTPETASASAASCLCPGKAPASPDRQREAPPVESRTAPDLSAAGVPNGAPLLHDATLSFASLDGLTPAHVPIYLGNAHLRF